MLMRTDSARERDRLAAQALRTVAARPASIPIDAWRDGDAVVVEFDLPGVATDSIDIDVDRNVVTVTAERPPLGEREVVAAERPRGVRSRQLVLGDNLDTSRIEAAGDAGVLRLRIPVAERAKPRKISISQKGPARQTVPA